MRKQRAVFLHLRVLRAVVCKPRLFMANGFWLPQLRQLRVILAFLHYAAKVQVIKDTNWLDGFPVTAVFVGWL